MRMGWQSGLESVWLAGGTAWPATVQWIGTDQSTWKRLWQERDLPQCELCGPDTAAVRSGTWRDDRLAKIEAVLFLAREPLSSRKIAQLVNLADGTEARTLVRRLNRLLDDSASPFRAEEVAGGFQLMTGPMFGPWLRRRLQSPVEVRLSAPALETLAVVAYRQPVLRAEVDAIRGVQSGEILRQLMERDLVRITGRANDLGRPLMYGTTKRFLQVFGLRHLDELPQAKHLRRRADDQLLSETIPGASRADEISLSHKCIDEEEAK